MVLRSRWAQAQTILTALHSPINSAKCRESLEMYRSMPRWAMAPFIALSLGLALLLTGCQKNLAPQDALMTATVQQIISGNTLEVIVPRLATNQIQRVRLIGFDAPTPAQRPWGKEAMDFLRQVDKEAIQLEFDQERQDSYDRLLAYVWHNGELLNLSIVAEGHALMDARLPNIRYEDELRRGQESARLQGLGIWDPANPMRQTPDEFQEQRPK